MLSVEISTWTKVFFVVFEKNIFHFILAVLILYRNLSRLRSPDLQSGKITVRRGQLPLRLRLCKNRPY